MHGDGRDYFRANAERAYANGCEVARGSIQAGDWTADKARHYIARMPALSPFDAGYNDTLRATYGAPGEGD